MPIRMMRKVSSLEELLAMANTMQNDHPGVFAMQTAKRWRSRMRPVTWRALLGAVDARVGTFEVDAYEENLRAITEFGQDEYLS